MKLSFTYVLASILLLIIGFFSVEYFLAVSNAMLELNGLAVSANSIQNQFKERLLFCFTLGAIPLLLFLVQRINGVRKLSVKTTLIIISVLLVCGILAWQFRIHQLNNKLEKLAAFKVESTVKTTIPFDSLDFSLYVLLGFFIGAFASFLIIRRSKVSK